MHGRVILCYYIMDNLHRNPYSLITHTPQPIPRGMGYKGVYCTTKCVFI